MSFLERVRAAIRAFVVGQAVVRSADTVWGHDVSAYAPPEYGDYISTSNAVYACATLRSGLLGSLNARVYRTRPGVKERTEVTSGPLPDLLQRVNPFWTFRRLIEMTELTLCVWGEAFWMLERGESGKQPPAEIWWVRPDRVRVVPHVRDYVAGYLLQPVEGGMEIGYRPNEVIWMRYPNPVDEFAPLSPLSAARLAADYASAAMKSNLKLFENGIQAGGLVAPKGGMTFSPEQAETLMESLERRFRGVDRAHRWGVLRAETEVTPLGMTPQDAEFIQGLNWSLEDVARAYRVPLDLVGGQRTYENVRAAMRAIWVNCLLPEAGFIASELTEQLQPMFPGQGNLVEFDTSAVDVLQEDQGERWRRAQAQISAGAVTINEWRTAEGLEAVPWGDAWWAPATLLPVRDGTEKPPPAAAPATAEQGDETEAELVAPGRHGELALPAQHRDVVGGPRGVRMGMEYGGDGHRQVWGRFVRRTGRYEEQIARRVVELFERQRDSVVDRVKNAQAVAAGGPASAGNGNGRRGVEDEPFDRAAWVRRFRETIRPALKTIVEDAGEEALADAGVMQAFDVAAPAVRKFLEQRAQRFAVQVNETTWEMLRESLSEGMAAGENIPQLLDRVHTVMAERIRSTPETIARTEAIGAANGGTLEAWRQSGVVERKTWIAALDARTRETHIEAHEQTVGLDEDFEVGGARGPAPGQMGEPDEDVNCRCTMIGRIGSEE